MGRKISLILTCEHATNRVPPGVALGLPSDVLQSHVAWDPGAIEAARQLQERFAAPLFSGEVSRLVVDLNRSPERAACVPENAFGVEIPGNIGLDPSVRSERIARWHRPFRALLSGAVRAAVGQRSGCLHLSVHTFTDVLADERRNYAAGVLFDPSRPWEAALAEQMLDALAGRGIDARANQPYAGTEDGTTTWLRTRFAPDDYAGLEIELCQANTEAAQSAIVEVLADVVAREQGPQPQ